MFKFLFFVVFVIIAIVFLMGFSAVRTIYNILFGGGTKNKPQSNSSQKSQRSSNQDFSSRRQEKIFSSKEGEYVDFEEIKEKKG